MGIIQKSYDVVVTAASEHVGFECVNVLDGISRTVHENSHCWMSAPLSEGSQWLDISFDREVEAGEVNIKFDSNLSRQLMLSMFTNGLHGQEQGIPPAFIAFMSV